jgi:DNA-binding NtrC family response regulator
MPTLLLVDDEESLRSVVAERLTDEGFEVTQASDGEAALKALDGFAFDVIVPISVFLVLMAGKVIDAAITRYPGIIAIVVTGYGTVKDAVDMIKLGAADFISKPFQFDELMHVLNKALEQRRLKSENAYLHEQLDERFGLGSMVGKSAPMRSLFQLIETVAPTATTILITGETGTGKEMVRARDSSNESASSRPLRGDQRQRDSGNAARCRALRPRQGRLHRRRGDAAGPARASGRRHAVSRRSRHHADGVADEDAARPPGTRVRAPRR